jgi:hypothetical protein
MPAITAVMIDSREPVHFQQMKFGGVPVMVTALQCGDVQAVTDDGCTLVFERKTLSDFLNSLADDRLFVQLARMMEIPNAQRVNGTPVTQYCYLVITDPIAPDHNGKVIVPERGVTGWSYAAVQGTILSIQEMGVQVVWCNGQNDYQDCILRIGKRNRAPHTLISAPRPAKLLGPKIDFLTGLPGVGVEHAQKILAWAGDNVAHALIGLTDLEIASPFGIIARRRIRALMGLQDSENLEITGTEIIEPIMEGQK